MDKNKLEHAVKESNSVSKALKLLNKNISSGNYRTFYKYIKLWNIDTSHFIGRSRKGIILKECKPLSEILTKDSWYNRTFLKKRLIKGGILKYECSFCKISNWQGKKISLQLDHINGINNDNNLENLRLLCPNCHSQTDTYTSKNKVNRSLV